MGVAEGQLGFSPPGFGRVTGYLPRHRDLPDPGCPGNLQKAKDMEMEAPVPDVAAPQPVVAQAVARLWRG